MSRPLRIGLGVLVGVVAIIGIGFGYTSLVGSRPDIGNPDFATVQRTLPGTWNLQQLSQADFIAGLIDEFPEADLRAEMTRQHLGDPVDIAITFGDDGTASAVSMADGTSYDIGEATYRVSDNHTVIVTDGECEVPAQFILRGDTLTFGIIGPCPTADTDLFLAVVLRGGPFTRAPAP